MQSDPYLWEEKYPKNIDWNAQIIPKPVFALLEEVSKNYPKNAAMSFLGKTSSWGELYTFAAKAAKGLQEQGVHKGVSVGILLPNSPYYIIAYYAILMAGGTVVNLNPLYADDELKNIINDSQVKHIISADLKILYDKIEKMLHTTCLEKVVMCPFVEALPLTKQILFKVFKRRDLAQYKVGNIYIAYEKLIGNDGYFQRPDIDVQNDIAVLQYTGGTTGIPKAAMLTHKNIYTNAIQAKLWFHEVKEGQDRILGVLPFFHVFAMTAVMNFSVACGLEIVTLPRFDLKETLKLIHKKKVHLFPAVPAIYSAINHSPLRHLYDLSSLKYCLSGGAPLPVEVKRQFEENTGCLVIEGYGLTEASPVACVNLINGVTKPASIGLPWPNTIVEIIDPKDKKTHMPVGERGELCIRGPQVMKGYWNNKPATDDVLRATEDGDMRLYTGDIAIMDGDGFVFIVDRLKDMIITNGYNVYPRNVEEAIYQHSDIEECIVAGIPDEQRGEIVKAWIKLKEGRTLSEDDLKAFLKDKISPMEIPRRIEFRTQPLPKTMIGKLSKKDVLAQEKA